VVCFDGWSWGVGYRSMVPLFVGNLMKVRGEARIRLASYQEIGVKLQDENLEIVGSGVGE